MSARLAAWFAALVLLAAAAPLAAQQRWIVRTEPGTPVVALEVLVAAGPLHEDSLHAGLAFLAARSVVEPMRPRLEELGAHLRMESQKDAISFSLIAPSDTWREASRTLLVALFRDPPGAEAVMQEQRALVTELLARQANPADALAREVDRAVYGVTHAWGRPAVGYPHTIARLTVADVDAFLRAHVTPERSVAALVGPVDATAAAEHLRAFLPPGRVERPGHVRVRVLPEPVMRDYNAITTWVTAVYPLAAGADLEAVRFLAEAAADALAFGPLRRSVYDVHTEVLARVGGGELRIQAVVPPHEATQWAERMGAVVRQYAAEPPGDPAFAAQLRYFRGRRLMGLASPEARARELARLYLISGDAAASLAPFDGLSADRVRESARGLGSPTLVFLGPFLDAAR